MGGKFQTILIVIMSILLIASGIAMSSKGKPDKDSVTPDKIREIVRDEIKNELESFELNIEKSDQDVDYEKIEQIVEEKLDEFNKDFGENFEEATDYFGGKIKDTWTDIEEHMRK